MGYEVKYIYHERVDGKYNTEETKEMKKKIGTPMDDTPLEQLAGAVLAQMARRDILVIDVEIQEYTKRTLSFKQSNDGVSILIKGKKFSLDRTAALVAEADEDEVEETEEVIERPAKVKIPATIDPFAPVVKKTVAAGANLAPAAPPNQNRVLFGVIYEPNDRQKITARARKLRLTEGKKYPVHRATNNDLGGQTLWISDDTRNILEISEDYFSVAGQGLVGDNEVQFSEPRGTGPKPKLMYEGSMRADPNIMEVRQPAARREVPEQYKHIPIDGQDVGIPDEMFQVPVLRPEHRQA